MTSESVRRNATRMIYPHDDPPEDPGPPALADSPDGGGGAEAHGVGRLWREDGRLMYKPAGGGEAVAARMAWARPLSGREGPVSIMRAGKKRELAYLSSLDELPEESRRVAREELAAGMVLPRITEIREVKARHGNYYFETTTDRGPRRFLVVSPENNSARPSPDVLVIRDVSGNCFEINPVSRLDKASLKELDRVL